jgi:acetyl/propionyl-CoA carboxylase alpha subunit/acetyl-CoA carboxylase carboxyltransferase component
MSQGTVLVANRGEIAVRILRTARQIGLEVVLVHAEDDGAWIRSDYGCVAHALTGSGPAAYLDREQLVRAAVEHQADMVHPGCGFLSEDHAFADLLTAAGVSFVGPTSEQLRLLGDKTRARALARDGAVPVLPGTDGPTTLDEAARFLAGLPDGAGMMIKPVAGGGGRGIRVVRSPQELPDSFGRCQREALQSSGDDCVYVERYLPHARHVEVQVVGDGTGSVVVLGDRDCSLQRRFQKVVEIAPAPWIHEATRRALHDAARRLGSAVRYRGVGTFEFLVSDELADQEAFVFIEANPRLQVEHTVTEEVFDCDLVQVQLRLTSGVSLSDLRLDKAAAAGPRGYALEARLNAERFQPDGTVLPSAGTVSRLTVPTAPDIRFDSCAYAGYPVSTRYDSLLGKCIVRGETPAGVIARAAGVTGQIRVDGVDTNAAFLSRLLAHSAVRTGSFGITFIQDNAAALYGPPGPAAQAQPATADHGIAAPTAGVVVSVAEPGTMVHAGGEAAVIEAMKMEHAVTSPVPGVVQHALARPGDAVAEGELLLSLTPAAGPARQEGQGETTVRSEDDRSGLAEAERYHDLLRDSARPAAVDRRHAAGHRTMRENLDDFIGDGTFREYGGLVVAAQRQRHPVERLRVQVPADGVACGVASVRAGAHLRFECVVVGYDYTVLAGTQGHQGHRKVTRLLAVAERNRLPVILFGEGGGGRAGETDGLHAFGLDHMTFRQMGKLSGLVPLVGVVAGPSFAGNAALLGMCDVIIATNDSNIGMGGPAMIEGGGLGVHAVQDIGPAPMHAVTGAVDVVVPDDATAVATARTYLSYFQGRSGDVREHDQAMLRSVIPENRARAYDVRTVIEVLADADSVLELRREFGASAVTALARIDGETVGIIANDPTRLAGAIDSDAADKLARFLHLCDVFSVPVVSLCDTPGIMVGPQAEETATIRHSARLFIATAKLRVPFFCVVLRRAFGLGAQAMVGGSVHAPEFTVAWPTGEFGSMGFEGLVRLGYRKELASIADAGERDRYFEQQLALLRDRSKAVNAASHFELDDVIDPAATRSWIVSGLKAARTRETAPEPYLDPW